MRGECGGSLKGGGSARPAGDAGFRMVGVQEDSGVEREEVFAWVGGAQGVAES